MMANLDPYKKHHADYVAPKKPALTLVILNEAKDLLSRF
jgi:hypothetical protein